MNNKYTVNYTSSFFLVPTAWLQEDLFFVNEYEGYHLWWDASSRTLTQYSTCWGEDGNIPTVDRVTKYLFMWEAADALSQWVNHECLTIYTRREWDAR